LVTLELFFLKDQRNTCTVKEKDALPKLEHIERVLRKWSFITPLDQRYAELSRADNNQNALSLNAN
jgi:hypothetical protein